MTRLPLTLLFVLGPALATAQDWRMDPAGSELGFRASAQGETFTGYFTRFRPAIRFDPEHLEGARFDVRIELDSVDTRSEERDETLRGSDFFEVREHPEARYVAESFRALGAGRFAADGTLTLRGISRVVTLRFTWQAGTPAVLEGRARLAGEAELNRLDFGLGSGDWADPETIAHEVEVFTRLTLLPVE